jgi:hypothetical protein
MRRSVIVLVCAAFLLRCSGKDPYNPGTPLGVFHITGKLTANACAAADQVPDPWEFDVKLSRDGSTVYWIQGGLPVQGHLDTSSHATLTSIGTTEIRPADPKTGASGCTLQRADALDATFAGDPVNAFQGTLAYAFSPTSDSDCSDQLAQAGGGFSTLPCQVAYAVTAVKTDKTTITPPTSPSQ